ncbi:MAG: hypothetical protein PHI35_08340 [Victivallaceae bacterium]|nr:hypothetical protein [Victivallaceae bacterium]
MGTFKPGASNDAVLLDFASPERTFVDGYCTGKKEFLATVQQANGTDSSDKADFTSDIKGLVPSGGTFVDLIDLKYTVTLKTVDFKFNGLALEDNTADSTRVKHSVDFVRWHQQPLKITANKPIFKTAGATASDDATATRYVVKDSSSQPDWNTLESDGTYYYVGGMETRDPRQNLNFDGVTLEGTDTNYYTGINSDWRVRLAVYDAAKTRIVDGTDWSTEDNFTMTIVNATDDTRIGNGTVNSAANPSAPGSEFTANEFDTEIVTDPAWKAAGRTGHLSTAFIRNKPVKSPWELGLIHRGAPWQTINIKNAVSPNNSENGSFLCDNDAEGGEWKTLGTKYSDGDAGLLDQIKMTCNARSWGKVDVNRLHSAADGWTDGSATLPGDKEIVEALFTNVFYDNNPADVWSATAADDKLGKGYDASPVEVAAADVSKLRTAFVKSLSEKQLSGEEYKYFLNRVDFLSWLMTGTNGISGGNIRGINKTSDATDAENEELIGKTFNLITASTGGLPNVITVMVVAQTIKDIAGAKVVRFDHNGNPVTKDCAIGTFDVELKSESADTKDPLAHVYFDEITGEVKLIATFERNPITGKMVIRKTEYID